MRWLIQNVLHALKNALSLLFYLQYMEDILEQIHLGSP